MWSLITSRNAKRGSRDRSRGRDVGVSALTVQADISEWEQVKRMFAQIHRKFGPIDILVNNSSRFKPTPLPTNLSRPGHSALTNAFNHHYGVFAYSY